MAYGEYYLTEGETVQCLTSATKQRSITDAVTHVVSLRIYVELWNISDIQDFDISPEFYHGEISS